MTTHDEVTTNRGTACDVGKSVCQKRSKNGTSHQKLVLHEIFDSIPKASASTTTASCHFG